MTERERAAWVTGKLCRIYPDRRPLLTYASPFQLAIAVILSAQTTDAQVNVVTPELFDLYPDPAALAAAQVIDVERIVHSTGFYRTKARNIVAAAARIHTEYRDELPQSFKDLTSIPGMGRKSANVIRGVVFGLPSIVVDTHLSRVTRRLGFVETDNPARIEAQLREIVPEQMQTDFSMAINLHGRACCQARNPQCAECVVASRCRFAENRDSNTSNRKNA